MTGHGTKFGLKKEEAVAALLVQRNLEDAARAVGISPKTLLRWMKGARVRRCVPSGAARGFLAVHRAASAGFFRGGHDSAEDND